MIVQRSIVAPVALACSAAHGGILHTGFDAGLEGWVITNTIGAQWQGAGGNPGGYAHIDNTEQLIAYMFAPILFLGDLSRFDGGVLSFDAIQLGSGGGPWDNFENFGRVIISSGATSASRDLVPGIVGPATNWTTYSASLTATEWGMNDAQWLALLSDVTSISLCVEGLFGPEINGVDNFTILPAPGASALMAAALALSARRRRPAV